jgi:cytochrome b561
MNVRQTVTNSRVNSAFKNLMSIHWWMAGCYIILFVSGCFMARLPGNFLFLNPIYDFHKSIGAITMALLTWRILILLRVWWRKYTRRLPNLTPKWWKFFLLHTCLYIFMWAVPVSGFFLSNSYKNNNVKILWFVLPDLFPENSTLVDLGTSIHFWMAYTFLAFTVIHILAYRKVFKANMRRFSNFINNKLIKFVTSQKS